MPLYSSQVQGPWGLVFGSEPVGFVVNSVRRGQSHFRELNNRMVSRTTKDHWPFLDPSGKQHDIDLRSYAGEDAIATALKLVAWANVQPQALLDEAQRQAFGFGSGQGLEGDMAPPAPAGSVVVDNSTVAPPAPGAPESEVKQALLTGAVQLIVQLAPMLFGMLADMAKGLMQPPPVKGSGVEAPPDKAGLPVLPLAIAGLGAFLMFKG